MLLTFYEQNNRAYLSQNQGHTLVAAFPPSTPVLQIKRVARQYLKKATPKIGDIKKGEEIGKGDRYSSFNYIFHACIVCGKTRWVRFQKGKPLECTPRTGQKGLGEVWRASSFSCFITNKTMLCYVGPLLGYEKSSFWAESSILPRLHHSVVTMLAFYR